MRVRDRDNATKGGGNRADANADLASHLIISGPLQDFAIRNAFPQQRNIVQCRPQVFYRRGNRKSLLHVHFAPRRGPSLPWIKHRSQQFKSIRIFNRLSHDMP